MALTIKMAIKLRLNGVKKFFLPRWETHCVFAGICRTLITPQCVGSDIYINNKILSN